jgi:hypothetical protein
MAICRGTKNRPTMAICRVAKGGYHPSLGSLKIAHLLAENHRKPVARDGHLSQDHPFMGYEH